MNIQAKDIQVGQVLIVGTGVAYKVTKTESCGDYQRLLVFCEHLLYPLRISKDDTVNICDTDWDYWPI